MNLVFFAPRSTLTRCRDRFLPMRADARPIASAIVPFDRKSVRTGARLTAIWHVNPETGRIECRWTNDSDEIARWLSRPWIERAGLILAAAQQSRFGMAGSFR